MFRIIIFYATADFTGNYSLCIVKRDASFFLYQFVFCSVPINSYFFVIKINEHSKLLLKKTPKKGTIKVKIDGKPTTEGTHWSHDSIINQVILKQPYPKNGAKISVCYEW